MNRYSGHNIKNVYELDYSNYLFTLNFKNQFWKKNIALLC